MDDDGLVDQIMEALAGVAGDLAETVLDALADVMSELGALNHDDVVHLVQAAVNAAAGAGTAAAVRHYLTHRDAGALPRAGGRAPDS